MKMQPSDPRAVEQIDTVFGRRDEAFSKDERKLVCWALSELLTLFALVVPNPKDLSPLQ
jgi:hypothetical protein